MSSKRPAFSGSPTTWPIRLKKVETNGKVAVHLSTIARCDARGVRVEEQRAADDRRVDRDLAGVIRDEHDAPLGTRSTSYTSVRKYAR
jgi:hypothetical protein